MIDFALLCQLIANQNCRKSAFALEQYLAVHAEELVRLAMRGEEVEKMERDALDYLRNL